MPRFILCALHEQQAAANLRQATARRTRNSWLARPVADIVWEYGDRYLRRYRPTPDQRRVMWAIENCRTAKLGGHMYVCDRCGEQENRYNSCRNRHCPKCQWRQTMTWLQERERDLLPVPYFHVVFTVPAALRPLFLGHQRLLYGALFASARDALRTIAREPRHLGASIGTLAVLHSWSQDVGCHPHLHCVVPGGGLASGGQRWQPAREDHLLPVQVLAARFRTVLMAKIEDAYRKHQFDLGGSIEELDHPVHFADFVEQQRMRPWVVYAKEPFAGPRQVLRYLARYTHRIAISNRRLLGLKDGRVHFTYKDYRAGGEQKTMYLDACEFIRRFLLHVLPPRFVRLRYFGFLANRNRRAAITVIRALITPETPAEWPDEEARHDQAACPPAVDPTICPACGEGQLIPLRALPRPARRVPRPRQRAPP